MSRQVIEQRRHAIRKHLFLLCPNNSGSTYLSAAMSKSRSVWSLAREGQHVVGFAGPSSIECPWPLIWGMNKQSIAHFRDSPDYDWERTKKAWYFHARSQNPDAPVFVTKSPPFLLIPDQLMAGFAETFFLFMVRNPYAALEGIIRRRTRAESVSDGPDLPVIAARHLITCLSAQKQNIARFSTRSIAFTYEELCAGPDEIARRICALVPELDDLDLAQKLAIKGTYDEPLRNMNDDQIGRLTQDEIALANRVFRPNAELLSHFGYQIMEESAW